MSKASKEMKKRHKRYFWTPYGMQPYYNSGTPMKREKDKAKYKGKRK